jgi:hypothetical protein
VLIIDAVSRIGSDATIVPDRRRRRRAWHSDAASCPRASRLDGECDRLHPFVGAPKAVFVVEYELPFNAFCARARADGFMAMRTRFDLDAWREPCW